VKDLNLIPSSFVIDKRNKIKKTYLSILIICIGFISVLSYVIPTFYEYKLKDEKSTLERQVSETNNFVKMEEEFSSLKSAVEERESEGKLLSQKQLDMLGIVHAIEAACPEKLFIQKFDSSGNNASDVKVALKGVAANEEIIASFLRNLMDDDYFDEVKLATIANNQGNNGSSFEIGLKGIKKSNLTIYNGWNSGFRIGYPSGWNKSNEDDSHVLFSSGTRMAEADPDTLEVSVISTDQDLLAFAQDRIETLKENLSGFEEGYMNKTVTFGTEALKTMYHAADKGIRYQYMELCTVRDGKGYTVTYKSDPISFANKARTVDRILKSFTVFSDTKK
jgi:uncharacterized protein (UPF0333 family)